MAYRRKSSDSSHFAIINAGGIRATIDEGDITRGEILTAFPFGNAIVELTFTGEDLWKMLEGCVSAVNQFTGDEVGSFFQVSKDIRIEYNPNNEPGSQLVRVTIGGEPLSDSAEYNVVTINFLASGGDNIFVPQENFISLATQDEALIEYVQENSPIDIELDGRIAQVDGSASDSEGSDSADGAGNDDSAASTAGFNAILMGFAVAAGAIVSF